LNALLKKIVLIAVVVGVGAVFVWLNVQAPRVGINPLGDLMAKTWHLGLFVFFWWAVYAVGRGAERFLAGRRSWPPEMAAALGVVAFVVAAFALCAVGLAYGWLAKIFVVGVAVAGAFFLRKELARLPARVKRWLEEMDVATAALVAGAAVIALPVALQAAEPPYLWDALAYYLAVPKAYAAAHGFAYLPHDAYASTPLGATLFSLWPLLWDGFITANASHLVATVLVLSLTYRLARTWLDRFYAAVAAVLVLLTPFVFAVMGGAHVDHFTVLFAVSALYLYIRGRNEGAVTGRRWAAAVGVFIGAAVAVGYAAIPVVVAFLPLWVYDVARKRTRFVEAAVIVGVAAAVVAPWLVKAYVERGNPVFPLAYDIFGGRDFTAEQARRFVAWRADAGLGRGLVHLLLSPYRVSVGEGYSYQGFYGACLPLMLPLAAAAIVVFRRAWRAAAFAWVFFLAWAFGPQQLRFLGPALPAFAVGAAAALAAVDPRKYLWPSRVWRAFVAAAVLALGLSYVAGPIFDSFPGHVFLTGMSRDEFLAHRCPDYRAQVFINDELPADATVLMVFINQVLYTEKSAVYDSFPDASAFLLAAEKAAGAEDLYLLARSWGVTHVFVYSREEDRLWRSYAPRARDVFYDFLHRYAVSAYEDEAARVYELVAPPG
jgi:hypothetical protein